MRAWMRWAAARPSPRKPSPHLRADPTALQEVHPMERLSGIHAVREALAAGRPLQSVIIARGRHGERLEEIVRMARRLGVPVRFEDRVQLDRAAGSRDHQGVAAMVAARAAVTLDDLLARKNAGGSPGLLVL